MDRRRGSRRRRGALRCGGSLSPVRQHRQVGPIQGGGQSAYARALKRAQEQGGPVSESACHRGPSSPRLVFCRCGRWAIATAGAMAVVCRTRARAGSAFLLPRSGVVPSRAELGPRSWGEGHSVCRRPAHIEHGRASRARCLRASGVRHNIMPLCFISDRMIAWHYGRAVYGV